MGKVKRLELWRQLYRTSLPVWPGRWIFVDTSVQLLVSFKLWRFCLCSMHFTKISQRVILRSSEMWRLVIWYIGTDVSGENAATMFEVGVMLWCVRVVSFMREFGILSLALCSRYILATWLVDKRCVGVLLGVFRRGNTSCVPRSRNCISCVPRCPRHVYQLRPELSTPNMTSFLPRLVRNCTSCTERCGCTKCQTIGRFLHSFVVLYFIHNYMHTYRIVEWYRQHSCYIMLLSKV